jgi:hypothetical protein
VSLATRCMAFATPPFRFSANLVCAPPPPRGGPLW